MVIPLKNKKPGNCLKIIRKDSAVQPPHQRTRIASKSSVFLIE